MKLDNQPSNIAPEDSEFKPVTEDKDNNNDASISKESAEGANHFNSSDSNVPEVFAE